MTREELMAYASRYVSDEEVADFPVDGDLFCMMARELPNDRAIEEHEGWQFAGYGICSGYSLDEDEKPQGKWVWFEFLSLVTFPPRVAVLRLQPPHVVKGRFQNTSRTLEYRMLKVPQENEGLEKLVGVLTGEFGLARAQDTTEEPTDHGMPDDFADNLLEFPRNRPPNAS